MDIGGWHYYDVDLNETAGERRRGDRVDNNNDNDDKDKNKGNNEVKVEEEEEEKRENWGSEWEFIFSCVGLSVGIGNVWRFPYLAYENGGGAFLFPYFILLIVVGKPLYFMEIALGQFSQQGPTTMWSLFPLGKGIGFAMCTVSLIVAIYYNVIIAYCFHYIYASFAEVLPWETCDADWADKSSCFVRTNLSGLVNGSSACEADVCVSAAEQYWNNYVLGVNKAAITTRNVTYNSTHDKETSFALDEFGNIGTIKWDLAVALLLSWAFVFLCLSKGIKSSGKVVYFSATFPYVILLILLVRGLLLEGALEGVKYFFLPQWDKLLDITVWRKAAEQMFFSLSISWGGLIMFGSYNKFRCKVHIHALVISSLDFLTSIIAGVVIFSILGNLQLKLGLKDIKDVIKQKQGLAFIAYPEAVSLLPIPQLWSVLFFFMLLTLGLDSEFALLETFLTGIYDICPRARKYKATVCFLSCCACFLISLPCISYSGAFVFDLMDTYGGGVAVFWVAIFETVAVMWCYGVNNFCDDVQFMLKYRPGIYFKACWYAIPVILTAIFGIACYYWEDPTYNSGELSYPTYAHAIGWGLTVIVAAQIPIGAIVVMALYFYRGRGVKEAFKVDLDKWGPADREVKAEYLEYRLERRRKRGKRTLEVYDNHGMQ